MSLFRAALLSLCLCLAACGFEPMYGSHSRGAETIAREGQNIDIANIPDRDGQYLRNLLIDRLYTQGRPADAAYELRIGPLEKNIINLGIRKDASATRAQLSIVAPMALIDKASGKPVLQRTLRAFGAYNILENQLSTLTSQQDVVDSVLREIRDSAVTELDLFFRRKVGPVP